MRYELPDGKVVSGRSYKEIVAAMSEEKLVTPPTLDAYRKAAAARASQMYGVEIEDRDDKSFILSLERAGILIRAGKGNHV